MYVQEDPWARILWHDYYNTENIENIFVGSSHVYADVNPSLLDNINEMNNFDISVGSMQLNAAYYAIKEVASAHDIKNVYLELYYFLIAENDVLSDKMMTNSWRVTDYLKLSLNKVLFVKHVGDSDKYLETLFPFIRYKEHFLTRLILIQSFKKSRQKIINCFYISRKMKLV